MSQLQVPKSNATILLGSDGDEISAPKVMLYLILEPGTPEAGEDSGGRQGHVHAQILRRS